MEDLKTWTRHSCQHIGQLLFCEGGQPLSFNLSSFLKKKISLGLSFGLNKLTHLPIRLPSERAVERIIEVLECIDQSCGSEFACFLYVLVPDVTVVAKSETILAGSLIHIKNCFETF